MNKVRKGNRITYPVKNKRRTVVKLDYGVGEEIFYGFSECG